MSRTTVAQAVLLLTALVHCTVASSAEQLRRAEPGKRLHVFILAGQSNMEGRADGLSLSQQDRERLRKAQPRVQLVYNQRPAQDLDVVAPPDDIKEIYHVERIFGPELFFGVTLAEAWPAERILPHQSGGGRDLLVWLVEPCMDQRAGGGSRRYRGARICTTRWYPG